MTKPAYLYVLDTLADWEPGFLTAELNTGSPGGTRAVGTPDRAGVHEAFAQSVSRGGRLYIVRAASFVNESAQQASIVRQKLR